MKNLSKLFLLLFTILIVSCDKGDDIYLNPNEDDLGNGIVKIMNNTSGGTLSATDGSKIIVPAGSIGQTSQGQAGEISFSIENDIRPSDVATPIPSKYQLIGNIIKFSPSSFIFSSPLMVYLPAASLTSLENVKIIRLDELKSLWEVIPISDVDATNKLLGASTFELGYFAVVIETTGIMKVPVLQELHKSGGLVMSHPTNFDYYYTILVVGFTPRYTEDANSGVVGSSGSTGNRMGSDSPAEETRLGGIPQGTYQLEISRIKRGTFSTPPSETQYYSQIITIDVGGFSNTQSWDWKNWTGWTYITLSGGDWVTGTPPQWPTANVPFGTGQFQATLTWVNTYESATDIDLHLFGPNGTHVYWSNPYNSNSSILLDRDWRSMSGYATENIYSAASMPSGEYKIYVNPFSGSVPKNYEVRIILRGNAVKTFRGTATTTSTSDGTPANMILIHTFSI